MATLRIACADALARVSHRDRPQQCPLAARAPLDACADASPRPALSVAARDRGASSHLPSPGTGRVAVARRRAAQSPHPRGRHLPLPHWLRRAHRDRAPRGLWTLDLDAAIPHRSRRKRSWNAATRSNPARARAARDHRGRRRPPHGWRGSRGPVTLVGMSPDPKPKLQVLDWKWSGDTPLLRQYLSMIETSNGFLTDEEREALEMCVTLSRFVDKEALEQWWCRAKDIVITGDGLTVAQIRAALEHDYPPPHITFEEQLKYPLLDTSPPSREIMLSILTFLSR